MPNGTQSRNVLAGTSAADPSAGFQMKGPQTKGQQSHRHDQSTRLLLLEGPEGATPSTTPTKSTTTSRLLPYNSNYTKPTDKCNSTYSKTQTHSKCAAATRSAHMSERVPGYPLHTWRHAQVEDPRLVSGLHELRRPNGIELRCISMKNIRSSRARRYGRDGRGGAVHSSNPRMVVAIGPSSLAPLWGRKGRGMGSGGSERERKNKKTALRSGVREQRQGCQPEEHQRTVHMMKYQSRDDNKACFTHVEGDGLDWLSNVTHFCSVLAGSITEEQLRATHAHKEARPYHVCPFQPSVPWEKNRYPPTLAVSRVDIAHTCSLPPMKRF